MADSQPLSCPFCAFEDIDADFLLQHVNLIHPENENIPEPMIHEQEQSVLISPMEGANDWIECPCGEFCLLTEFQDHLDLHETEGTNFDSIDIHDTDMTALLPARGGKVSPQYMQTPPVSQSQYSPYSETLPIHSSSFAEQRADNHGAYLHLQHSEVSSSGNVMRLSSVEPANTLASSKLKLKPARLGVGDIAASPVDRTDNITQRAELGPYHNEESMPSWLRKMLEKGAKTSINNQISRNGRLLRIETVANEIPGIIPVLGQLCAQDNDVLRAYLCHPDVTNVVKMPKEGGFCGYRNIQMMISYIQKTRSEGHSSFPGRIPSILHLQEMIEHAWDMGFNHIGRVETGGIRGTRKYIGTPEAQALFNSLDVRCTAEAFSDYSEASQDKSSSPVHHRLLQAVEQYFQSGNPNLSRKVCRTSLPPIYFQHPGHSLTVVGFERRKSGSCNLLVFDPMYKPSPGISRLIGAHFRMAYPARLLKAHRRGESYLKRYRTFEILRLTARVPSKAGWDGS